MIIFAKKWLVLTCWTVCTGLLFSACDAVAWADTRNEATPVPIVTTDGSVSAEGQLVPQKFSALGFQTGGELGELLVREGEMVSQGDVLARLGKREPLEASLSQARLELLSAGQALDELTETAGLSREQANQALVDARIALNQARIALQALDTDDFQQQLDDLNLEVQEAEDELEDAREELEKFEELDPNNNIRERAQTTYDDALRAYNDAVYARDAVQYELDQAKAGVNLAAARLDEAQRQSDRRIEGVDPDSLALAQARVELAAAQVAAAQRALDNADLVAPYDGLVVELNDLQAGELVSSGQAVLILADFSTWMVETRDLTELDVVNVEIGQHVQVIPDALPDLKLKGIVESIDRVFTQRSGDILYTVRISLLDGDPSLRWGMTVNAAFQP